jgi:hypothetical protein
MLDAVELKPCTIVTDYTVDQFYRNDCRYFGKTTITFNDWIENINHYPNVIFDIATTLDILNTHEINNIFDLAIISLLQDEVAVDPHVVYNFTQNTYYF